MRKFVMLMAVAALAACGKDSTAGSGSSSSGAGATGGSTASTIGGSSSTTGASGTTSIGTTSGSSGSSASSSASSSGGSSGSTGASACPEYAPLADGGHLGPDPWEDLAQNHTLAERGTLLRCVHVASVTAAQLTQSTYLSAYGDTAEDGAEEFIIQYLSVGRPDEVRAVTALLYAPSGADGGLPSADGGLPLVAVDHGTSGMSWSCGPTHQTYVSDYMSYPLVAHGYVTVDTDYAGMGVDDGLEPYANGASEGANALDAVRAARQMHDPRFDVSQLSGELFAAGHSQGGQASLFTHALLPADTGMNFLGSIAFAPGFGDMRGLQYLFTPNRSVGAQDVFIAMAMYGDVLGNDGRDAGAIFSTSATTGFPSLLHDQCLTQLFFSVPQQWPTMGDLYDANFLTAAQSCDFTGPCASFQPWSSDLLANLPGAFTSTQPVLIMQGESDTTVAPYSTACIADRLTQNGTTNWACGYPGVDHLGIVQASMPKVLSWLTARRAGMNPDVCMQHLAESCPP
jgi:hypothetical protein